MKLYVDCNAGRNGNGSKEMPFKTIRAFTANMSIRSTPELGMPASLTQAPLRLELSSPEQNRLRHGLRMKEMYGYAELQTVFLEIIIHTLLLFMETGTLRRQTSTQVVFI